MSKELCSSPIVTRFVGPGRAIQFQIIDSFTGAFVTLTIDEAERVARVLYREIFGLLIHHSKA